MGKLIPETEPFYFFGFGAIHSSAVYGTENIKWVDYMQDKCLPVVLLLWAPDTESLGVGVVKHGGDPEMFSGLLHSRIAFGGGEEEFLC